VRCLTFLFVRITGFIALRHECFFLWGVMTGSVRPAVSVSSSLLSKALTRPVSTATEVSNSAGAFACVTFQGLRADG
jgi:hypothetical protein